MRLSRSFALSYGLTATVVAAVYFCIGRAWLVQRQLALQCDDLRRECRLLSASNRPAAIPERLVYVERNGIPVFDSEGEPLFAIGGTPELVAVRGGAESSQSLRYSASLGVRAAYVACHGQTQLARIGARIDQTDETVKVLDLLILGQLGLLLGIGAVFSRNTVRRLDNRLRFLQKSTEAVLDVVPPPRGAALEDEFGDLSLTVDSLRRRVEQERRLYEGNDERFRSMLDQMQEGLALVQGGRITVANRAYCELLSVAPPVEGLTPLEATRLPAMADLLAVASASRERQRRILSVNERALSVEIHPFGQGDEPALVLVLADVSETERLDRVRRDFVANASHELRTPVAAILGATETLLGGAADNPVARGSFLAILARHAQRLERLTSELLDLSRLEHGYKPQIESVTLRPVLQQVSTTLERDAEERGVTLELQLRGELPPVATEKQGVEQIVYNLVHNAIKYTPRGGTVRLSAEPRDDKVAIVVEDSGPGIAREHYQRLFERFYRVDDSRSRQVGGSGVGLSIVKHLCAAYGGSIVVDSVLGSGSKFTVTLRRT